MTFEAAMQIPMKDKTIKAEARRQLSQRDDALTDVTEHGTFKWWLFLSNLGPNTNIKQIQCVLKNSQQSTVTEHGHRAKAI